MKILISSDHGGFQLKKSLINELAKFELEDLGPFELEPEDDYPKYAFPLAERVVSEQTLGILICRSGNGMVISANKVYGARAALCFSQKHAEMARRDDHANILVLDADYELGDAPVDIVRAFLTTEVSQAERHVRRVEEITSYEQSKA